MFRTPAPIAHRSVTVRSVLRRALTLSILWIFLLGSSCILDPSVNDFTFQLPRKTFSFDTTQHPIPTTSDIPCTPSPDSCASISEDLACGAGGTCEVIDPTHVPRIACSEGDDPCGQLGEGFSCDLTSQTCQVTIPFELVTTTNLADEVPELKTVGSSSFTSVRFDHIRMYVQENTFAVDTPPVDFYVAPVSVSTLWVPGSTPPTLDPQAAKVGTVPSIPAGVSGESVDVETTPTGKTALTDYCRTPEEPFNLFVYTEIALSGGDPVPTGALAIEVDAKATVGLN